MRLLKDHQLQILIPICILINKCQSFNCHVLGRVDEAAQLWIDLELKVNGLSVHTKEVQSRKNMA